MRVENRAYLMDVRELFDEDKYHFWYEKMPESRRSKIDRIKPEGSKRLSLGAGILLYEGLRDFEIELDVVNISLRLNEKPYIEGEEGIFFNLSHSKEVAVCAISDSEVGIDAEQVKEFKDSLIDYVFASVEADYIKKTCGFEEERNSLYTRLWTMKESIMKFYGTGISMNPKNIVFNLEKTGFDDPPVCYNEKALEDLHITHFQHDDYHISICSKDKGFCAELTNITI